MKFIANIFPILLLHSNLSGINHKITIGIPKELQTYNKFLPWYTSQNPIPHDTQKINTQFKVAMSTAQSECNKEKNTHLPITKFKEPKKPIPWHYHDMPVSAPPALTGCQMGSVETLGMPPLGYEMDGNIKVFHLTAQPVEQYLTNGSKPDYYDLVPPENRVWEMHHHPIVQKMRAWGYNGQTPGPTIEVFEGDRIRVILKNELPEPTSIHWHGVELPNNQDGASPETQRPALPGETIIYEFTLYQSGTLMYHSGYNIMRQDHFGLHGMLVVHPKKYENPIDRDIAIFLQQFSIIPGNIYPNIMTNNFNWFAFNGKSSPNIPKITVNQGQRVRIRFANTIMDPHPIHIHGYVWEEVGTEEAQFSHLRASKVLLFKFPQEQLEMLNLLLGTLVYGDCIATCYIML